MALGNISLTGIANWFTDTSTNQHVTLDLATLPASKPYLGNDNLHVDDGRDFPYLISVIQKYIHLIVLSLCLMFFMFIQSRNVCFLFRNFVSVTMFILNFTILCFMSRISTPMKSFSHVRVKMVSMLCPVILSCQFLKLIGLPASLFLLIYGIVDYIILPLVFFNY